MQVITPQAIHSLSKLSNYMAGKLALIGIFVLISALIPVLIIKILFFWAPRKFQLALMELVVGMGGLFGLYLAFKFIKL